MYWKQILSPEGQMQNLQYKEVVFSLKDPVERRSHPCAFDLWQRRV